MPRPADRAEVLARLRDTIASGKTILGAGAGQSVSSLSLSIDGKCMQELVYPQNSSKREEQI